VFVGCHADPTGPPAEAGGEVYRIWRSITARELSPGQRGEFAARATALQLVRVEGPELAAAGQRVFAVFGMLLLTDWREEIEDPGLAGLRAVTSEWPGSTEAAALTLQAEIATLVEAATSKRKTRPVLRRRLGLDGDHRITLAALGTEYSLSRERIRQLQERHLQRLAALAGRSRRSAVLQEVIRGLAAREEEAPAGAVLDEIAGLVFPGAAPDAGLCVLAVLAGYPARLPPPVVTQVRQARVQRAAAGRARRRTEAAQIRATVPLRRLLAGAWWPPEPATSHHDGPAQYQRTRELRDWEHSGEFISDKLDRAVGFESGLEHRFLQLCERSPDVAWYQEQPLVIPYTFGGSGRDYHPDVLVQLTDGRRLLVEVKHLFEMASAVNQAKQAAARGWCDCHGAGLLITDLRVTHAQLTQWPVPSQSVAMFTARLHQAPLTWPEVHALQITTGMTAHDLTACCLRHGWVIDTAPWRLQRVPQAHHLRGQTGQCRLSRPDNF
jgi:hypothetical protein